MRQPKGHTQQEIAAALDMSQPTVSRMIADAGITPRPDGGYHLRDVVQLAKGRARPSGKRTPEQNITHVRETIRAAAELSLIPFLAGHPMPWHAVTHMVEDVGLPREIAGDVYVRSLAAIFWTLAEGSDDPAAFSINAPDDSLFMSAYAAKQAGTLGAWAAKHWPKDTAQ